MKLSQKILMNKFKVPFEIITKIYYMIYTTKKLKFTAELLPIFASHTSIHFFISVDYD